jgi:hypothetical protein
MEKCVSKMETTFFYLQTSGNQNSNLYLNFINFLDTAILIMTILIMTTLITHSMGDISCN